MLCVLCYACSGLHFHTQVKAMLGAPKGKDASGLSDDETIEKCLNEVEAALNAGLNFKGKFNSGLQVHLLTVHLTFSIYTGAMHVSDHKAATRSISAQSTYIAGQSAAVTTTAISAAMREQQRRHSLQQHSCQFTGTACM